MIPFIKKYIFENWDKLDLGARPEDLLFIKFADRGIRNPAVGTISFLAKKILYGKESPIFILRIPRYAESEGAGQTLRNEYDNLNNVHAKLKGSSLTATIPKPILFTKVRSSAIFMLSVLPGKDMAMRIIEGNIQKSYIDNFRLAFSWLVEFQKSWGMETLEFNQDFVDKYVKRVFVVYRDTFPQNAGLHDRYFNRILAKAKRSYGKKVSVLPQHGDFHAANIFVHKDRLSGVIDWEDFREEGLPCHDLFHYIKTYLEGFYAFAEEQGKIQGIEAIAWSQEWGRVVSDLARSYCQAVRVDIELMEIFLPLFLVETINVAGSFRKIAPHILRRNDILLGLEPFTIDDLRLYMSIFPYGALFKKASAEKNMELAKHCQVKVGEIQKIANRKKAQ